MMRMPTMVLATLLTVGCTGSDGTSDLADGSTAEVLVPDDRRFLDSWSFRVEDSTDNYTFRSNWSPSFDPDIDPDLLVVGYQVNDPDTWTGGSETGTAEADRAAIVAAVTDSASPGPDGPCTAVDPAIDLVACSYDTGGPDGPLDLAVRRFADPASVMIVITDNAAAVDYLSGDFTVEPVAKAISGFAE